MKKVILFSAFFSLCTEIQADPMEKIKISLEAFGYTLVGGVVISAAAIGVPYLALKLDKSLIKQDSRIPQKDEKPNPDEFFRACIAMFSSYTGIFSLIAITNDDHESSALKVTSVFSALAVLSMMGHAVFRYVNPVEESDEHLPDVTE
ncbi:MAG TPA: hypothetical protein VLG50_00980 [Candidatus Saccharimonadales bacterium]|nr:hypothetical protein [Candidatus Saccharimonadales bacterium]